jgi:hypothetical protein
VRGFPTEKEIINQYSEIVEVLCKYPVIYYVASDGKDSNPGTLDYPFRTLNFAISAAKPGDTIFVRGGVYFCSGIISIDKSGQAGEPIRLRAYPGENPVFDFSATKGNGFLITGAYWHIQGITVTKAEYWGIRLQTEGARHNILEQIIAYNNGLAGIALLNGAAYNLVLNCDSYQNFDPVTNGENADGFNAAHNLGKGNIFIGCRAWNNSDDGFDCGMGGHGVRLENCYAWGNGENIWDHPCFTGNANGFKLWAVETPHVLIHCAAWDHRRSGFTDGGDLTSATFYNCIALRNKYNYILFGKSAIKKVVVKNCLSFEGGVNINQRFNSNFNSWNTSAGFDINNSDFLSLDDSKMMKQRNSDGSIQESDFLRLAPNSDLIDRGTDVGLSFNGKAPDLGAFEYRPAETNQNYIKMLHQAVRDYDTPHIRSLLSKGADINEKDWLGYTPLHWAAYFGYPDVAEILISEGANPNLMSDTGRIAPEVATDMGYEHLVEVLRKHKTK